MTKAGNFAAQLAEMKNFIHVGGVPEHYNYPWQAGIEQKCFAAKGLDVRWSDYAGGTGAMCAAMEKGDLDLAVLLPEGIISHIMLGGKARIVQSYVKSPLMWGVHVAANSPIKSLKDLGVAPRFAISRPYSGSHLMAFLLAGYEGFSLNNDSFEIAGDLTGARKALQKNSELLFLWEKYTAKPLVESGEVRRIGEIASPWPSFVIAASEEMIYKHPQSLKTVLKTINGVCEKLMKSPNTETQIAVRYGLNFPDTLEWFEGVKWNTQADISMESLREISRFLYHNGLINRIPEPVDLTAEYHLSDRVIPC